MATHDQFDQLAERLRKLSMDNTASSESIEKIMDMTLEELSQCPIDFGKAHLGKLYRDMTSDTKYLAWFAETYKHSQKIGHIRFLRFIELHLNKIEGQMAQAGPKSRAKAKGAPKQQSRPPVADLPHDPWHPPSDEEELMGQPWEPVRAPTMEEEKIVMMRERMGEMENVSQQILSHLNPGQPTSSR